MGTSTNGILAFGVDFGSAEEGDMPEWLETILQSSEDGFDDFIAAEAGIGDWSEAMSEAENDAYWTRHREAIANCPVEYVVHCSADYEMVILAVRGTVTHASRGYPANLDDRTFALSVVPDEMVERFRQWIRDHGGEEVEPTWLLASYWG